MSVPEVQEMSAVAEEKVPEVDWDEIYYIDNGRSGGAIAWACGVLVVIVVVAVIIGIRLLLR